MKIICIIGADDNPSHAEHLARIINSQLELTDVQFVVRQEKPQLPHVNIGTVGHSKHKKVTVLGNGLAEAMLYVFALRNFECALPEVKCFADNKGTGNDDRHNFAKISQLHKERSRQEIVRSRRALRPTKRIRQ